MPVWTPKSLLVRFLLAASAVLLIYGVSVRLCGVPPQADTHAAMWNTKRRVLRFAHENGSLPTALNNLPEIPGHRNSVNDWWGNPIEFQVDANGIATLRSAGGPVWGRNPSEGEPTAVRFPTKGPDGNWANEMVEFLK